MTPFEFSCVSARAFSPVRTSALGDTRAPYLQQRRGRVVVSSSCNKLLVSQTFTESGGHEAIQTLQRVPLHVAFVQPESEFVDIAANVLRAGVMVDTVQAAFQDSPNTFDAVRADVAAHVLAAAMVDCVVVVEQTTQVGVAGGLVGVDGTTGLHVAMDRRLQRGGR